jgi:hypothetical protein
MRKPVDVLAEGLISKNNRGDRNCTFVIDPAGLWVLSQTFPRILHFDGDEVLTLVQSGLYKKHRKA